MTLRREFFVVSGALVATAACGTDDGAGPANDLILGMGGAPYGVGGTPAAGYPGSGGFSAGTGGNAAVPTCGNGVREGAELCDGADLGGQTCASMTLGALTSGAPVCTPGCTIDTTTCGGASGAGGSGLGGQAATGGMDGMDGGLGGAGGDGSGGTSSGGASSGGASSGGTSSGGASSGGASSGGAGGSTATCCPDGNCLCHGPDPTTLTSGRGPFGTATFTVSTGTVHYPTNAEPPFAGVAICPGFLNTGPEMATWGTFYASYGIVTVVTNTLGGDLPDVRATKLLASVDVMKSENTRSGSALFGKMSDRYGTSGYSMGGGGTTIATGRNKTLKTSVGLAAWGPVTTGVTTPTLLLCGSADTVAPCNGSQSAYTTLGSTPKMLINIQGSTHFSWFGPTDAGGGTSGKYALAFQKVYLEGDLRWKPLLVGRPTNGTMTTNIQ